MRLHSIELLPDEAGDAAVRADWAALRAAGLPSLADHRGATNAPHVTAVAVPAISAAAERRAAELFAPLLPIRAGLSGLAVFGRERLVVARVVDLPDEVVAAVLGLRSVTEGHLHPGWLPHVTLARGVPRVELQRVVDALDLADVGLELTGVRRWDPDACVVTELAGA